MTWTFDLEHPLGPALTVRRHRLENGLTLLSVVDREAPIVTYQTWYRVGSRDEEVGRTGMAHLFEHLMFNQTRSLPPGELDRIIEKTGGDTNAATWVDWTFYRDTVPARDLELVVKLEAERMTDLVLEPEPLESERQVVINERLERVDDDVDGFANEELFKLAFTTHPYHWPTIGWMDDIRAIDLGAVRRFYRTFYAPNNATIVVVGDVDEDRLLALVEGAYGGIPAADLVRPEAPLEPEQTAERRTRFFKPTQAVRLAMGWKAPAMNHPDWPVLLFAGALLTGSPSARLTRRLFIEDELVSSIDADVTPFRDPSLFQLSAVATRGTAAGAIEAAIDEEIARLAAGGIDDDEIAKVRNLVETGFWAELETIDGKAESLGHYETSLGDFRHIFSMADALARIGGDDVARVARDYLVAERRTVIEIVPEEPA